MAQVGTAVTWFPGTTVAELEAALLARKTKAVWGKAGPVPATAHIRQVWRAWTGSLFRGVRPSTPHEVEPRR
ncbi:MAG: hypothetical protein EBT47_00295 [Chloroflexi bacterium]|nr:hypothetical protein [Chloroflexota bacterium]